MAKAAGRAPALLVAIIVILAVGGCLPAATGLQPQVLVTRVPADLRQIRVSAASTPAALPVDANTQVEIAGTLDAGEALPEEPVPPAVGQVPQAADDGVSLADSSASKDSIREETVPPGMDEARDETRDMIAHAGRPLQATHNILLMGMDERNLAYPGRTDTLMLLALDVPNQRAALISFPRDIYLPIPGVGYSRINTAYFLGETRQEGGGVPLLTSTFEKNFDVPIHNFVRIDLSGFEDIVDAIGGVDITLDCELYDETLIPYFQTAYLEAGDYHMNGSQALFYARSRKTTSDFDRARRQQQVLMALRKRMLDADLVTRIPALWSALHSTVDTDLGAGDVFDLAKLGATIDRDHLYGMVLRPPLVSDWITPQGAQVQIPDLEGISEALDHIWERKPLQETNQEERFCGPEGV